MIRSKITLISILLSVGFSQVEGWNSTTFEYLWNRLAYSNQFRTNIEQTPFEFRVCQLAYTGSEYKAEYGWVLPGNTPEFGDTSVVLLNQNTISIPGLTDPRNLRLTNVEVDLYRVNYLMKYFNQNTVDFQHGLTWNYIEGDFPLSLPGDIFSNEDSSAYHWEKTPDEVSGVFRYNPMVQSVGVRSTVSWKPLNNLQLTGGIFAGYAFGSLYKSTGGDRYLKGDGIRFSSSLNLSFIVEDKKKNFNYMFGVFGQMGRLSMDKLSDSEYRITPISGFDIYTSGVGVSVGVQFGGRTTPGDRGYRKVIEDDYLHAMDEFAQFFQFYPGHPQIDKARELMEACKTKIPTQAYENGLIAFQNKQFASAGDWMRQAKEANDKTISTLAGYKLDRMASILIDSVRTNLEELSLKDGEELLLIAIELSDEYDKEAKILQAKIYLAQGDILLGGAQYGRAIDKYNEARKISPDLKYLIKEKEKTLARAFLLDVERGIKEDEKILVIESLRWSRQLYPDEFEDYDVLINALENIY